MRVPDNVVVVRVDTDGIQELDHDEAGDYHIDDLLQHRNDFHSQVKTLTLPNISFLSS